MAGGRRVSEELHAATGLGLAVVDQKAVPTSGLWRPLAGSHELVEQSEELSWFVTFDQRSDQGLDGRWEQQVDMTGKWLELPKLLADHVDVGRRCDRGQDAVVPSMLPAPPVMSNRSHRTALSPGLLPGDGGSACRVGQCWWGLSSAA